MYVADFMAIILLVNDFNLRYFDFTGNPPPVNHSYSSSHNVSQENHDNITSHHAHSRSRSVVEDHHQEPPRPPPPRPEGKVSC